MLCLVLEVSRSTPPYIFWHAHVGKHYAITNTKAYQLRSFLCNLAN